MTNEPVRIQIGTVHFFTNEFLNSIRILMYHAQKNQDDMDDHIYTIPTILLTMSFLESAFELFIYDIQHGGSSEMNNIKKAEIIKKYHERFKKLGSKYAIEKKYNDCLSVMGLGRINNTDNVITIRKVRNYLVHDKIELLAPWLNNTEDEIAKLLKNKFEPQRKISPNKDFWADYINYKGTTWLINEIFDFYIDFCSRLKIDCPFGSKINEIKVRHPFTVKNHQEKSDDK